MRRCIKYIIREHFIAVSTCNGQWGGEKSHLNDADIDFLHNIKYLTGNRKDILLKIKNKSCFIGKYIATLHINLNFKTISTLLFPYFHYTMKFIAYAARVHSLHVLNVSTERSIFPFTEIPWVGLGYCGINKYFREIKLFEPVQCTYAERIPLRYSIKHSIPIRIPDIVEA